MRLQQTVSGGATTRLAYDGLDRIAEYDAASILLRRYAHGPGDDEPIVWYEGSGTTDRRFLGADERGSIISVTDSAGAVLGINRYDEYGQPQSTNLGAFGYTGQAWLPTVGAWYYKARVYESELGRFLQPDPIGTDGGINLYAYVGNDPVNLTDPTGLCGEDGGAPCPPILVTGTRLIRVVTYITFPTLADIVARTSLGSSGGGGGAVVPKPQKEESTLKKIVDCALDQYGFGDDDNAGDAAAGVGRAASEILASPVPKELAGFYRHPGSSSVTNVLNALSVKTRVGSRLFFSGSAARISNTLFRSARVLTVVGRANVITGALFAAYDAGSIAYCTYKKGGN